MSGQVSGQVSGSEGLQGWVVESRMGRCANIRARENMVVTQGQLDTQQLANGRFLVEAGSMLTSVPLLGFICSEGRSFFACVPRIRIHFLFNCGCLIK